LDHQQLQQVLMSLILNGIDAMKGLERTRELVISSQRDGKDRLLSLSAIPPGGHERGIRGVHQTRNLLPPPGA
jgi:C4-dicarboxylate-specific signal transduction histidine kinase